MRSFVCVAAAGQRFFQPAAPSTTTGFLQPGLQLAPELVQAPVVEIVRLPQVSNEAPNSVAMLAVAGVVGAVVGAVAGARSAGYGRAGRVAMVDDPLQVDSLNTPNWNDPREGYPFEDGGPREAKEAFQPRGISDASTPSKQYIETEDEPWLSDTRSSMSLSMSDFEAAYQAALPFVAAEKDLTIALSKCEKKEDAKKAMKAAEAAGARPGCAAFAAGEKLIKAFEEKGDEDALKARPKAPKAAGAQGNGWDNMKRQLGKTHDNSVA